VKPAPFAYAAPTSLEAALDALADGDAKVLAGGQSLLPLLSMRLVTPDRLVDINQLPGLEAITATPDRADSAGIGESGPRPGGGPGILVGALARHAAVAADPVVGSRTPLVVQALGLVGHPAIRNRGTVVGSIVHADPAAELPAVTLLLGGQVHTRSRAGGERVIPADQLYVGPLQSALRPDELATAVWLPALPARTGTGIEEVSRRRGDYALVGVAGLVRLDDDLRVVAARAAYFSVDVVPVLLDLTDAVAGSSYDAADWPAAARLAQARTHPGGDIHASPAYRRQLVGALTRRVLTAAAAQAVHADTATLTLRGA
jgi:carbon-monoxide dehydrogenase medium subunit